MDGGGGIREAVRERPASERLVPPAPTPPERDLSIPALLFRVPGDQLGCWPARAYRDLVVRRRFFGRDYCAFNDPDAARRLMVGHAERYGRPVGIQRLLRPGVGNGLLLAEGRAWRTQRARLASMFTPRHVDALVPHIQAAAEGLVERLSAGGRVNLHDRLEETAIDSLGRAMFSISLADRAAPLVALVKAYFVRLGQPQIWDLLARREGDFGCSLAGRRAWSRRWFAEIDAIIRLRREAPAPAAARTDVLELLFRARDPDTGEPLDDAAVRDEVASTMAAGFETTSRLLIWSAYLLARDRVEQDAVRAEIQRAPPRGVAGLDGLQAWPRLKAVLLETLRLYPPVPFMLRVAREPDEACGVAIRPGDVVMVSPWLIQRHHRWWDRPGTFLPERFANAPERLRDGTFIPFGLGPRTCVGATFAMAEASLILAALLARYDVRLDDPRPVMPTGFVTSPSIEPWFRLRALA